MASIREMETGTSHVPAIALTARTRPEDVEQALPSGFQMHLSKPIDSRRLVDSIASLVHAAGESGSAASRPTRRRASPPRCVRRTSACLGSARTPIPGGLRTMALEQSRRDMLKTLGLAGIGLSMPPTCPSSRCPHSRRAKPSFPSATSRPTSTRTRTPPPAPTTSGRSTARSRRPTSSSLHSTTAIRRSISPPTG